MRKFVFFVFILIAMQAAQADEQKLSQAYEQQLIERVKSVFSPQAAVEVPERPICATPIFLEVKANWERLSERTRKILQQASERPTYNFTEYTYDTPEGNFKIHYVRDGDSAVYEPNKDDNVNGHPDWVDGVAAVLEHVWDTEIEVLRYEIPPSDSLNPGTADDGGDDRYDIYLLDFAGEYLGYTQSEYLVSSTSVTSHIVLDNDYSEWLAHSRLEWLQVTAAHEFFHAVQMGYDGREYESEPFRPYWMEMSAVWMEDMVYDEVNDYLGYLHHFFNEPWLSLKTFRSRTDQHAYGSCVWPIFLSERFDASIIKDIWEGCAGFEGNNAIDCSPKECPEGESATDKALKARGANFEEAFREFTVWNYFTGERAIPDQFYSEGADFGGPGWNGMVWVDTDYQYHRGYPVNVTTFPYYPENLAANYVVFVTPLTDSIGGIEINFNGESGNWMVSTIGYDLNYLPIIDSVYVDIGSLDGVAQVRDWTEFSEVVMVAACVSRPTGAHKYQYSADYDTSLHGAATYPEADTIKQNYPNPFVIKDGDSVTKFPLSLKDRTDVSIYIFSVSGELVRKIFRYSMRAGNYDENSPSWNGKNEEGEYVSSGVYLYQVKTRNSEVVKKMAVIR